MDSETSFGEATPTAKSGKGSLIACIILLLLLIGVSVFAVITTINAQGKINEIDQLKQDIAKKDETIKVFSEATGIEQKEDIKVEDIKASGNFIPFKEAGIKMKLSDKLDYMSFQYLASDMPSLHVWGVKKDANIIQMPPFANPRENDNGLGIITFMPEGTETDCVASCDQKVFTIYGYDVYYAHPQDVMSTDEETKQLEVETVEIIKQMLTNKDNYSKM